MTLPDPDREWTIDELAERTGEPYQTVATEIRRLEKSGLLTATDDLRAAWNSIREQRPPRPEEDPYEGAGQPRLPGL